MMRVQGKKKKEAVDDGLPPPHHGDGGSHTTNSTPTQNEEKKREPRIHNVRKNSGRGPPEAGTLDAATTRGKHTSIMNGWTGVCFVFSCAAAFLFVSRCTVRPSVNSPGWNSVMRGLIKNATIARRRVCRTTAKCQRDVIE
jgi:hypothetical protein